MPKVVHKYKRSNPLFRNKENIPSKKIWPNFLQKILDVEQFVQKALQNKTSKKIVQDLM